MRSWQREFMELALELEVLRFGTFKLKSGRISPYFFNAGLLNTGYAAAKLGRCYASAIANSRVEFDMLFGPAYKGIPLATLAAAALAEHHGVDVPYCFNRKETKEHGEGGDIIGAPLEGRVLVVDDVITAGTAIREAVEVIRGHGATLAGVVISLDRQERGATGERSAVQEVERVLKVPVVSLISLSDLITHLEETPGQRKQLRAVMDYQRQYGVEPKSA